MDDFGCLGAIVAVASVFILGFAAGIKFSDDDINGDMQKGAMEVYKGNTKLEYRVVDSVRVDSCVIFINKE